MTDDLTPPTPDAQPTTAKRFRLNRQDRIAICGVAVLAVLGGWMLTGGGCDSAGVLDKVKSAVTDEIQLQSFVSKAVHVRDAHELSRNDSSGARLCEATVEYERWTVSEGKIVYRLEDGWFGDDIALMRSSNSY